MRVPIRYLPFLTLLPVSFLLAYWFWPRTVGMQGYVEVRELDGSIQKIDLVCKPVYDTDKQSFGITGVSLPVTSVIKAHIDGLSTGVDPQVVSDQLHGLDLQQLAMCESLLLIPDQADIRQTFKDYIGAAGYLTQQIRTLNSSTSTAQYQQAANDLAERPTATVAQSTADVMNDRQNGLQTGPKPDAPPPAVFPQQPSLSEPPQSNPVSASN